MSPKRNHSIYVTDESWQMIEEIAEQRGITHSAAIELITRAFYAARFAIIDEIRKQEDDQPTPEEEDNHEDLQTPGEQ